MGPMIDMVFLLLVFFMVSARPLKPEADIPIGLPGAAAQDEPLDVPDEHTILIRADGAILLNEAPAAEAGDTALDGLHRSLFRLREAARLAGSEMLVTLAPEEAAAVAVALAAWLSWFHWREVVPHWSQRDAFAALRAEGPAPEDVVVAWRMNWKGETFYGRDRVLEVLDPARMREVAGRPGRIWVVTEEERIPSLAGAVGSARRLRVAGPRSGRYRLVELSDAPAIEGALP